MSDETSKTVNDKYDEIFEINTAIVDFTRQKILDLRGVAELHRAAAEQYDSIADDLAEVAHESARLIARGIAVEAGLRDEEDDEDEDDDA